MRASYCFNDTLSLVITDVVLWFFFIHHGDTESTELGLFITGRETAAGDKNSWASRVRIGLGALLFCVFVFLWDDYDFHHGGTESTELGFI
jgi:hypothetical protein